MECSECGYELSSPEEECPRCVELAAQSKGQSVIRSADPDPLETDEADPNPLAGDATPEFPPAPNGLRLEAFIWEALALLFIASLLFWYGVWRAGELRLLGLSYLPWIHELFAITPDPEEVPSIAVMQLIIGLLLSIPGHGYLLSAIFARSLGFYVPPPAALLLGIPGTIYFLLSWGLAGRSLGKYLSGLRLIGPTGKRPGVGRAVVRLLVMIALAPILGLPWWPLLWRKDRRGVHDLAAGTHLVRVWIEAPHAEAFQKEAIRELRPAPHGKRIMAFLGDLIAFTTGGVAYSAMFSLLFQKVFEEGLLWRVDWPVRTVALMHAIIYFLAVWIFLVLWWGHSGTSVGKRAVGLVLVGADGRPPGVGRALARLAVMLSGTVVLVGSAILARCSWWASATDGWFLAAVLFYFWPVLLLPWLPVVWRTDRRGLHDLVAGTRVVLAREA